MRDFTLDMYEKLLQSAKDAGFVFVPYRDFVSGKPHEKVIILRHDVDARPENSLATAKIENAMGIRGTYYFRCVKQSFDEEIILEIKSLGHEIGYHYEDLALCDGDLVAAYSHFARQLERFRKIVTVETICMHGSPLSKWDNRALWKKYNYKDSGIIAEPYFDTDFSNVLYLTDTGRKWNYAAASVRDKVKGLSLQVHGTSKLISLFEEKKLPPRIMINIHPQRWTNNRWLWIYERVAQPLKNVVKRFITK